MSTGAKKLIITILFLLSATTSYANGLSALIGIGKSQAAMQETLKKETKAFEAIKKAIETGAIKKGAPQDSIRSRYGKPVVIISKEGKPEKWVYKPGYATHFGGVKIYLFFDEAKKLTGIQILNRG